MSHEFDEFDVFMLDPMANVLEAKPAPRDGLDQFIEELELEQAGGPILPPKKPRLRSERGDDGEPFTKRAGSGWHFEKDASGAIVRAWASDQRPDFESLYKGVRP